MTVAKVRQCQIVTGRRAVNTNVTERNLDRIDNKLKRMTLFAHVCGAQSSIDSEVITHTVTIVVQGPLTVGSL